MFNLKISLRLICCSIVFPVVLILFINTSLSAKTKGFSSTDFNLANFYMGRKDVYFSWKYGSKKKTNIKEYGFLLEFEDRFEKLKAAFLFAECNDNELKCINLASNLSYLPFKSKKSTLFSYLQPYIGCAINYHYNKVALHDLYEDYQGPYYYLNLYQHTLRGFGVEPKIGIKIKDILFKDYIWYTEVGAGVYTYKSSLVDEKHIAGNCYTINTRFIQRIFNFYLGVGYQYKNLELDDIRLDDIENYETKYGGEIYYPGSKFEHHMFYFNLSYPF